MKKQIASLALLSSSLFNSGCLQPPPRSIEVTKLSFSKTETTGTPQKDGKHAPQDVSARFLLEGYDQKEVKKVRREIPVSCKDLISMEFEEKETGEVSLFRSQGLRRKLMDSQGSEEPLLNIPELGELEPNKNFMTTPRPNFTAPAQKEATVACKAAVSPEFLPD